MTTIRILVFLFLTSSMHFNGQISKQDRDNHARERKAWLKEYTEEYKKAVVDSIEFTGQLIDMTFGTTCGINPSAGAFIFKVTKKFTQNFPDTVAVIIQCAIGRYEKLMLKERYYAVKVSPNKFKYWTDMIWEKYEKTPRYFLMRKDPVMVN